MASNSSDISLLESKIIILLNKLKDNHLDLQTLKERNKLLGSQKELLEGQIKNFKEENKSLKIANNLLGSNEGKNKRKLR